MTTSSALAPEPRLRPGRTLIEEGRKLAGRWTVGACPFLTETGQPSEAAYKRAQAAAGRVMQHAQVGFRDPAKSRRAYAEVWETLGKAGARVDRYGICCDWAMGYPRALRHRYPKGTGLMLEEPEDFAALTAMAPVAPHFGDFIMGFPAAVENTAAALVAGSTSIGNLGQYFTFRLPHWDDDVAATEATVTALGLIAAQPVEVLVHSNLDDGFAALFSDLACCLGMVLLERYILEELIGAPVSHCYGHHFSHPMTRLAFQRALVAVTQAPGTMVYGNTVSYRGGQAENFASLASYLLVDIVAQRLRPSGHAVNPVPVTENNRIPDIEEIVEAQLFAHRLIERSEGFPALFDLGEADRQAAVLIEGAGQFKERVLTGLTEAGVDIADPAALLLALRRTGAKRLEELFGPGSEAAEEPHRRRPLVRATTFVELAAEAEERLVRVAPDSVAAIRGAAPRVLLATTDVHEHGKLLVEQVFRGLGVATLDGGVAADPDDLAEQALAEGADAIAVSTYNGIALAYVESLQAELKQRGLNIPVLIGGRLNQIPSGSNTSMPVDVGSELEATGAIVCRDLDDALPALLSLAKAERAA